MRHLFIWMLTFIMRNKIILICNRKRLIANFTKNRVFWMNPLIMCDCVCLSFGFSTTILRRTFSRVFWITPVCGYSTSVECNYVVIVVIGHLQILWEQWTNIHEPFFCWFENLVNAEEIKQQQQPQQVSVYYHLIHTTDWELYLFFLTWGYYWFCFILWSSCQLMKVDWNFYARMLSLIMHSKKF